MNPLIIPIQPTCSKIIAVISTLYRGVRLIDPQDELTRESAEVLLDMQKGYLGILDHFRGKGGYIHHSLLSTNVTSIVTLCSLWADKLSVRTKRAVYALSRDVLSTIYLRRIQQLTERWN